MATKSNRADRIGQHRTALEKNRQIILKTQTVCGICGQPVDFGLRYPHPLSATVDHIIPIAKGGDPSALENLQLAHRTCNRAKSDKIFSVGEARETAQKKGEIDNNNLPLSVDWVSYCLNGSV